MLGQRLTSSDQHWGEKDLELKYLAAEFVAETSRGLLMIVLDYCLVEEVQVLFQKIHHISVKIKNVYFKITQAFNKSEALRVLQIKFERYRASKYFEVERSMYTEATKT